MSDPLETLRRAIQAAVDDSTDAVLLPIGTSREIAAQLDGEQTVLSFSRDGGVICCLHETPEDGDQVTDLAFDALGVTLHLLSLRLNLRQIRIASCDWRSLDGALRGFCEEEG